MLHFALGVLVALTCGVFFGVRLLRFRRYRERLQHGPCLLLDNPRYAFDPDYGLFGKRKMKAGEYDPENEADLEDFEQRLRDKEHYESLLGQPGLSAEEQDALQAAYLQQQEVTRLKYLQRIEVFGAEHVARVAYQRQKWDAMKQIAATQSLWWQFWHCS